MKFKFVTLFLVVFVLIGYSCSDDDETTTPSSNAELSDLVISPTASGFTFNATNLSYTISIDSGTNKVYFTPTVAHSGATIQIKANTGGDTNFVTIGSGSTKSFNLEIGKYNKYRLDWAGCYTTIQVTAQDGTNTKTYEVSVKANIL